MAQVAERKSEIAQWIDWLNANPRDESKDPWVVNPAGFCFQVANNSDAAYRAHLTESGRPTGYRFATESEEQIAKLASGVIKPSPNAPSAEAQIEAAKAGKGK